MNPSLSDRQLEVLREAARVGRLVSVVAYPGGRLEDVASSGWNASRVPLPSDAEVRALVRSGHLLAAGPSAATSFYIADLGHEVVGAASARREAGARTSSYR